ncbi:MAG TPA: GGDEF domain-containing protein [Desulfuromonadaceae bacterium]|jgi:GGDEF domain-containing protein
MLRKLSPLFIPMAILLAAWFLLPRIPLIPPQKQELLNSAPYLLVAIGLILSFHFRRGRIFMVFTVLAFCYYLFKSSLAGLSGPITPEAWLIYRAMAILLPFNLLICALMNEKGVLTNAGRMRLAFLGLQGFIFWITLRNNLPGLWVHLNAKLIPWSVLDRFTMSQTALILFLMAALVALWRALSRQSPVDGGMFGCTVAAFIFLDKVWLPNFPVTLSTAAALILVIAIIQDSHNMAFRDDLTKLPSRRALNELLPCLGSRYTIAMVDVDHFKRFNDEYGHDVGDQVLRMISAKLMSVSGGGRPFRYGGEEFTIIFPGKGVKDAAPHLESLRKTIAGYEMCLRDNDRPKDNNRGKSRRSSSKRSDQVVSVTVSIGLAEAGNRYHTPTEVIKAADEALYKAKGKGRNQVCLASAGR